MIRALDELVERRIAEAQAQGHFDDLPGAGAPLELGDDRLVPEELRAAIRILKNAGYAPPEDAQLREWRQLLGVTRCDGPSGAGQAGGSPGQAGDRARRRLLALTLALESSGFRLGADGDAAYRSVVIDRLSRTD